MKQNNFLQSPTYYIISLLLGCVMIRLIRHHWPDWDLFILILVAILIGDLMRQYKNR